VVQARRHRPWLVALGFLGGGQRGGSRGDYARKKTPWNCSFRRSSMIFLDIGIGSMF